MINDASMKWVVADHPIGEAIFVRGLFVIFPIALQAAEAVGASYMPFAIGIMLAASASFATPLGYQTHLMVYGAGGYRFSDFLRVGLPLDIIVLSVIITLTPIFWPF